MKVLKKLMCCASYSIICSNAVLGANPLQMPAFARLAGKQAVTSVRQSLAIASAPTTATTSFSWLTLRNQGNGWNNKGSKGWVTNESGNPGQQPNEEREELMTQLRSLTEVLMRQTELLTRARSAPQSAQTPSRQSGRTPLKPAKITPITESSFESETFRADEESGNLKILESQENLAAKTQPTRPESPIEKKENNYSSDTVAKVREQFIDGIMQCVQVPNKVTRKDVIAILDLFGALPTRPVEGVTKVLNGLVNSHKSSIYTAVLENIQSKDTTLTIYRNMYTQLCEGFGEDPMVVANQVANNMIDAKKARIDMFRRNKGNDMTLQDFINFIVDCAHPLYPVQPQEVDLLLKVYSALPNRPKDGISKVLSGQVNSHKSSIYTAVLDEVTNRLQTTLQACRKIFQRVTKSANEHGIDYIYSFLNNKHRGVVNQGSISETDQDFNENSEPTPSTSEDQFTQTDYAQKTDETSINQNTENTSKEMNIALAETTVPDNSSNNRIETADGKYFMTQLERSRLNMLYRELAQYDAYNVNRLLAASTSPRNYPIWTDMLEAIDRIARNALQKKEEDSDLLQNGLKYFRKLYWLSMRITGKANPESDTLIGEHNEVLAAPTKEIRTKANPFVSRPSASSKEKQEKTKSSASKSRSVGSSKEKQIRSKQSASKSRSVGSSKEKQIRSKQSASRSRSVAALKAQQIRSKQSASKSRSVAALKEKQVRSKLNAFKVTRVSSLNEEQDIMRVSRFQTRPKVESHEEEVQSTSNFSNTEHVDASNENHETGAEAYSLS